jgi:hypothetical protein
VLATVRTWVSLRTLQEQTIIGSPLAQIPMSASSLILLQKSKVASVRIFGETLKREAIDDSNDLSRITEVAYEFSVRQ